MPVESCTQSLCDLALRFGEDTEDDAGGMVSSRLDCWSINTLRCSMVLISVAEAAGQTWRATPISRRGCSYAGQITNGNLPSDATCRHQGVCLHLTQQQNTMHLAHVMSQYRPRLICSRHFGRRLHQPLVIHQPSPRPFVFHVVKPAADQTQASACHHSIHAALLPLQFFLICCVAAVCLAVLCCAESTLWCCAAHCWLGC